MAPPFPATTSIPAQPSVACASLLPDCASFKEGDSVETFLVKVLLCGISVFVFIGIVVYFKWWHPVLNDLLRNHSSRRNGRNEQSGDSQNSRV